MTRLLTTIALGLAATAMAGQAFALTSCGKRDSIVETLAQRHGEAFAGGGIQSSTQIVEVWASADDGSWTILMTRADGTSCVVAAGTDWRGGVLKPVARGIPG